MEAIYADAARFVMRDDGAAGLLRLPLPVDHF
jgi:hypothetical protein